MGVASRSERSLCSRNQEITPNCTYDTDVGGSGSAPLEKLFCKYSRCLVAVLSTLDIRGDFKISARYPELTRVPVFGKRVHGPLGLVALLFSIAFQVLKALLLNVPFAVKFL